MAPRYTASDIAVLEGLEPVRKRPGMYIGGTGKDGLHHLLWEIVDNCIDEAIAGHASTVTVTLHSDGQTCTVQDNGRGIPVDEHPTQKRSALEVILTTLHAGGKFDGGAYKTSGGLHGVGASVVNALSSNLEARVKRGGKEYVQRFRRGKPRKPVECVGAARGTGTTITFTPDDTIFQEIDFDPDVIKERLEIKAYLTKGLRMVFKDKVRGESHELQFEGGVVDFLGAECKRRERRSQLDQPFVLERDEDGLKVELAMTWTDQPKERVLSFVNGIPTGDGGTHEQGFRDAVLKGLRGFDEVHGLLPKKPKVTAEDFRDGLTAVVSVFIGEPQFQGQTKNRLNNPEVKGLLDALMRPVFEQWLHANKSQGELILARSLQAARAREAARSAAAGVRRKSAVSHRLNLPGKLTDCSSTDPSQCELFIVEGDSAGGTAKKARDRLTQAILPLRGKVLNTEQASLKKVLANAELNNVVTALGCGLGKDFREDRLRYHRIVLLMDADSDGHHISTLLLTFFYRHMRQLITGGYVYLAQPPLFRVQVGKQDHWALDEADKQRILDSLPPRAKPEITRFKGLGEMNADTLFETTLDPEKRRLLQIIVPDGEQIATDMTVTDLMGRDPAPRYNFIMERADSIDAEALDV